MWRYVSASKNRSMRKDAGNKTTDTTVCTHTEFNGGSKIVPTAFKDVIESCDCSMLPAQADCTAEWRAPMNIVHFVPSG